MENRKENSQGHLIGGLILIGLGTAFLLDRMNIFYFDLGDWWPMFLIIPGLVMAFDPKRENKNGAYFMIMFGLIFQVAELGIFRWWRWRNVWPLMMIAIGVWLLIQHLAGRSESQSGSGPGSGAASPPQKSSF